jgi:hypothetical protein
MNQQTQITQIKLSENPSLADILNFNKSTKKKILEMRNKFGLLLGLATGLKAFHEIKDRNGNPLYSSETKSKLNYDTMVSWISKDAVIKPYERKTSFSTSNENTLRMMTASENFWANQLEKYNQNYSIAKECPDILIIGF